MSSAVPIAFIVNEQTPYRLHLHRRIVREMPEIELWSVFTHEVASSPWKYQAVEEIRPVLFGAGESTAGQDSLGNIRREWEKGGKIIQWLEEHGIRAIVLFGYNDPARLRLLLWCKKHRIPCFLFGDSNLLGERATGLRAAFKNVYVPWVIRQCRGVFHCGKLGRAFFLKYGADPAKLHPFPYEPDYDALIQENRSAADRIRERFGMAPDRRRLVFVGRLIQAKRPDLLLEAFRRIADLRPEWDLVIAGDGPLKPELAERAANGPLKERVLMTGFLGSVEEIAALYSVCDVFVLPSDYEPWGVVVTEAATRLALVASSVVGAAADVLEDSLNGKFFEAGDVDSLAAALIEVTRPDRIESMKTASPLVLARWRSQSDPVNHLRIALRACLSTNMA